MQSTLRLTFACFVCLVCLTCGLCAGARAQAPVVADGKWIALRGHLAWLPDPGSRLSIAEVDGVDADRFVPLRGALDAGFIDHPIWLRIDFVQPGSTPRDWVLSLPSPLLAEIALYQQHADGHWVVRLAGEDHPPGADDPGRLHPAFHLVLKPGAQRLYLRLRSRTPLVTMLEVWQPQAFLSAQQRTALNEGFYFGAYGLLLLCLLAAWLLMRDQRSLWYLAYAAANALVAAITVGWLQQYWRLPGPVSDTLLGLGISLGLGIAAHTLLDLLGIAYWQPRLTRAVRQLAWALCAISAAFILAGRYALGAPIAQLSIIALVLFITIDLIWLAVRGYRADGLQVIAASLFTAGVSLRLLRNLGVVEPSAFTDHAYRIAFLMHLLVMGSALVQHYRRLYADHARVQAEVLEATRALNTSLDEAVAQRTAELQAEVGRRVALENELRRALSVERQARQQQGDFFAMVSHEFRTPLAIIDTALQQLEADSRATPAQVRNRYQQAGAAVVRMTSLMDDYLSLDRLQSDSMVIHAVTLSLPDLLKTAAAEWPRGRVALSVTLAPPTLNCDPDLLLVAVRNLLANADRHAPQTHPIELGAWVDGDGQARISVRDAGQGIPADELPRVFSKYFRGRAAQRHPGTGLGLHLVRRIAELHWGSVSVSSKMGEGACFTLSLPLAPSLHAGEVGQHGSMSTHMPHPAAAPSTHGITRQPAGA